MKERLYLCLEGDEAYGPETAVPPGSVTQLPLPREVRGYFQQIVACHEHIAEDEAIVERVFPDGAVRLMFSWGQGSSPGQGQALVSGAATEHAVVPLGGTSHGLSIALCAGAVHQVLGISGHELEGQVVTLDSLWGSDGARLLERIATAGNDAERVRVLATTVGARIDERFRDASFLARRAAVHLAGSSGRVGVRALAEWLGVSPRRVQQLFQTHLGVSPRQWARLCRFRACLRLLRHTPRPVWAQLAIDAGFYDQAHLVNEFQSFCGLTPAEYLRASRGTTELQERRQLGRRGTGSVSHLSNTGPREGAKFGFVTSQEEHES